jgi:hypothetical protein
MSALPGQRPEQAEFRRRRRAIFTGLLTRLDRDAAVQALALWQAEFSTRPVFALHDFLGRVCQDTGSMARRGELHRALVRALSLDEAELAPDPGDVNGAAGAGVRHPGPAGALPAGARDAFEAVYHALMIQAEGRGVDTGVRVRVMRRLVSLGLPPAALKSLSGWVAGEARGLPEGLTLDTLRGLLHLAYISACEELGPVSADHLLAAALREAEKQAVAEQYPPRGLL